MLGLQRSANVLLGFIVWNLSQVGKYGAVPFSTMLCHYETNYCPEVQGPELYHFLNKMCLRALEPQSSAPPARFWWMFILQSRSRSGSGGLKETLGVKELEVKSSAGGGKPTTWRLSYCHGHNSGPTEWTQKHKQEELLLIQARPKPFWGPKHISNWVPAHTNVSIGMLQLDMPIRR